MAFTARELALLRTSDRMIDYDKRKEPKDPAWRTRTRISKKRARFGFYQGRKSA
jgi:hypothetical protein